MPAVVVDTDVASYLHKKDSRARLFRSHLIGREWVISFMTVAELDEWAERRRWGEARRERLEKHLHLASGHQVARIGAFRTRSASPAT